MHAARGEHLDSLAIERMERLQLFAQRPVPQLPIRQDTIDIKDHELDASRPFERVGGRVMHACYRTLARKRSCIFSAPTRRPCSLTTRIWLTLWRSITCTASAASASGVMVLGSRVMTSSTLSAWGSVPF